MPDDRFIPRLDDTRVGYFTTQSNNMTHRPGKLSRFHKQMEIRKEDPEKELSEPLKPIVYWIENTTPHDLRDIIKEEWSLGILLLRKRAF